MLQTSTSHLWCLHPRPRLQQHRRWQARMTVPRLMCCRGQHRPLPPQQLQPQGQLATQAVEQAGILMLVTCLQTMQQRCVGGADAD